MAETATSRLGSRQANLKGSANFKGHTHSAQLSPVKPREQRMAGRRSGKTKDFLGISGRPLFNGQKQI